MRNKIKDFSPADKATLVLRLSDIQFRKTATNADYASMIGFDGTDLIEVKMWKINEEQKTILEQGNGEIFELSGTMKDYQGKMQFNISEIRLIEGEHEEIPREEFYEYAKLTESELKEAIASYIKKIDNKKIKMLVSEIIRDYEDRYFLHPAAMSMHHNYYSGLAYHVYSMLKLSDAYLDLYPFLNKGLVYGGIILHDIGKLVELSGPKGTEYTKEGNLLGHISIGANIVFRIACKLEIENSEETTALLHIILSHHGLLDYGSPKEPQIPEAALIYMLDYSDSRLAALEKELRDTKKGTYSSPVLAFDRKNFYIPNL